jgi:hypothetical protein
MPGLLKIAASAAVCVVALSGPSLASKGTLKSMSASIAATDVNGFGVIHIVSTDGNKWSAIKPTRLDLQGSLSARMSTGFIVSYHMRLGTCGNTEQCEAAPFPIIYGPFEPGGHTNKISGTVHFSINTSIVSLSTPTSIGLHPSFDAMVAKCNTRTDLIRNGLSFNTSFKATFAIETDTLFPVENFDSSGGVAVDFRKTIDIPVRVKCEGAPAGPIVGNLVQPEAPFKVTSAELYLATFAGDTNVPSQGTACKSLRVTARFKTTKGGIVHFDLSHKVGAAPIKTVPISLESKKQPDGTWSAEYVNVWPLDKPTYAQFFVQETDGSGVSAGWKDINVVCAGGLADAGSQPPSDGPELRVLKSKFTVTVFKNDNATGCPANAALDIEFVTNKPGSVPFKVTGTDGFVWNFSIKAEEALGPLQVGEGQAAYAKTYRATHRRTLQIPKSTDASYKLEVRNVAVEPSAKFAGPDNLKVNCAGGLTTAFAVTKTELNIIGIPGCPTTAFAAARFITNKPGNVRYRLASDRGDVQTGVVATKKVGNVFVGQKTLSAKITKGGQIIFSAIPLDFPGKIAIAKRQYACAGPGLKKGVLRTAPRVD